MQERAHARKAGAHPGSPLRWKANSNLDTRLSTGQQCALFAKKANGIPGCITQIIVIRWRALILTRYPALMYPYLEYSNQLWAPQYERDMGILVESPTKGHGMIKEQEHLMYKERVRELGLAWLEKRRLGKIFSRNMNN